MPIEHFSLENGSKRRVCRGREGLNNDLCLHAGLLQRLAQEYLAD